MWPSDDTGGWRYVPPDPCGMCGADKPENETHCSPECATAYREILAKAKEA